MKMGSDLEDFIDVKKEHQKIEKEKGTIDRKDSFSANDKECKEKDEDDSTFDVIVCSFCNRQIAKNDIKAHTETHIGGEDYLPGNENPVKEEAAEENMVDGIECSFCKKIISKDNIRKHTKAHMQISFFPCQICGKSFTERYKLKIHMRSHTGEKPYKCDYCDKFFSTKGSVTIHTKAIHQREENRFPCDQCEEILPTKKWLLSHKKDMHPWDALKCHRCDSIQLTEVALRRHLELNKCRENCCDLCGKHFKGKARLKQHMNSHRSLEEKIYEFNCEKCGKCFGSKQGLTDHDRIHENIKPFPCGICGKYFRKTNQVQAHINTVHAKH